MTISERLRDDYGLEIRELVEEKIDFVVEDARFGRSRGRVATAEDHQYWRGEHRRAERTGGFGRSLQFVRQSIPRLGESKRFVGANHCANQH